MHENGIFALKNCDIFAPNIDLGYSLEPSHSSGSNKLPQSMFLSSAKKDNEFPWKPHISLYTMGFVRVLFAWTS